MFEEDSDELGYFFGQLPPDRGEFGDDTDRSAAGAAPPRAPGASDRRPRASIPNYRTPNQADPASGVGRPQILAPQANDWSSGDQEATVVRSGRPGVIILLILAVILVALIAGVLAAFSVFRGDSDAQTPTEQPSDTTLESVPAEGVDPGTEVGTPDPVPDAPADPDALQIVLTEDPFLCDGGTREFGQLSGAAPNEEVSFTSPQASGISNGTADADGVLPIRWNCDPAQAGTTWELTATGLTSGKVMTFIFAGVTGPPPVDDGTGTGAEATTPAPAGELTVSLSENPFQCNDSARVFGELSGAEPNEEVSFTSPQASGISNGTADADGVLPIRWVCSASQVGTTWELTATGLTSGRTATFAFTGS